METRQCPVYGHGIEPVDHAYPAADGRENVWLACGWVGLMAAPEPADTVTFGIVHHADGSIEAPAPLAVSGQDDGTGDGDKGHAETTADEVTG